MIGNNAIGSDAVGTSGANPAANLSCTLSASSTATASLTTKISMVAALTTAATLSASFVSGQALLSASLSSASSITASLNTAISLQTSLASVSSLTASLTSSAGARLQAILATSSGLSADLTIQQVIPMFTPSAARTINVQATSPVFTGGKWWTMTDPKKPRGLKDPDATIDITFDWSNWLDDIGSVQISDVTFTLNGLNSVGSFSDGTKVTVFVSGGTASSSATIACKIKTLTVPARTDERTVYIDIADE